MLNVDLTCVDVHPAAGVDHTVGRQVLAHSVVLGESHRDVTIGATLMV